MYLLLGDHPSSNCRTPPFLDRRFTKTPKNARKEGGRGHRYRFHKGLPYFLARAWGREQVCRRPSGAKVLLMEGPVR